MIAPSKQQILRVYTRLASDPGGILHPEHPWKGKPAAKTQELRLPTVCISNLAGKLGKKKIQTWKANFPQNIHHHPQNTPGSSPARCQTGCGQGGHHLLQQCLHRGAAFLEARPREWQICQDGVWVHLLDTFRVTQKMSKPIPTAPSAGPGEERAPLSNSARFK